RNHDLIIQSRVIDYHVDQFLSLAHEERWGFEHLDKNLSMIKIDDFPLFYAWMLRGGSKNYQKMEEELRKEVPHAFDEIMSTLKETDSISSKELNIKSLSAHQYKGPLIKVTKVGAAILDCLWNRGVAVVHHRENYRRYYTLTEKSIPEKYLDVDHLSNDQELYQKWMLRRVQQIGLASSLWHIRGASSYTKKLVEQGDLVEVQIDKNTAKYMTTEEILSTNEQYQDQIFDDRVRFIAPLDPLIWDRKLTQAIFQFDYVWEVYKPPKKRIRGYYCLPVLFQDTFLGQIDPKFDRKSGTLIIYKGYWEEGASISEEIRERIIQALELFCQFLGAESLIFKGNDLLWKSICEETKLMQS
ncbi:MAG: DNA glycosylase AlkZ-like family protein, partial [Promethearchaeota archaeon]